MFPFLYPLLAVASSVEGDNVLCQGAYVGDIEADSRKEFAHVRLHLGYHAPWLAPGCRPVGEVVVEDPWPPHHPIPGFSRLAY